MADTNAQIAINILKNHNNDDSERLIGITEALDKKDKEMLPWMLFYRDGLTLEQVAEKMNCTVYTLSPWLYAPCLRIAREEIQTINRLKEVIRTAFLDASTCPENKADALGILRKIKEALRPFAK